MLKVLSIIFTILAVECNYCSSARILGIVSSPSYSHQIVFRPIWRELDRRGHEVVVITTDPENDPTSGVKEIDCHDSYELVAAEKIVEKFEKDRDNPYALYHIVRETMLLLSEQQLAKPDVVTLLNNETEHFDLVIVEFFNPIMFGFARRFNCSAIGVLSLDSMNFLHAYFGNPIHSVAYPDLLLPIINRDINFWDRLLSFLFDKLSSFTMFVAIYYTCIPTETQFMQQHFGPDYPHFTEIIQDNMSVVLLNSVPTLSPRPVGPNIINFGGGIHIQPLKKLPKEIQSFLDKSQNGVIYMSLGTNIGSQIVNENMSKIFMDTFRTLPYNVLWKFDNTGLRDVPSNVKILKWVPQQDILRHPKVKLFIFQGGAQSLEEGLLFGVPMVGIPFIADQPSNVKKLELNGYGLSVEKDTLAVDSLREAILKVIQDPRYKSKVDEIAKIIRDQPETSLNKAVWWIEYVIRHKGAHHLRNPLMHMPFYQYQYLDIYAFLLLTLVTSVLMARMMFRVLKDSISYEMTRRKVKTN